MTLTTDQYLGLSKLERWYDKYQHQVIEISGVIGTGAWDLVQHFLELQEFDPREVMYLSYDQKQVLELAAKRYHAYYIDRIIYKYHREVDFNTLPVVNPQSDGIVKSTWIRNRRKKIDPQYRIIVVFDSLLMNEQSVHDLCEFGLPIILMRDPMLLPACDSYTFLRDPNITLREVNPKYIRSPIVYFAHAVLNGQAIKPGSYDNVTVVPRKQMNLYNLKASNMNITLSEDLREIVNRTYRSKILHAKENINIPGERIIAMRNMYEDRITNPDEKKIKLYLDRGTVGTISRIPRHAPSTKYVSIDFKPEFYEESFEELYLDRHALNHIDAPSRQAVPDEIFYAEYAYALTPHLARYSHWDKGILLFDEERDGPMALEVRNLYTAITRIKRVLTIIL